MLIDLSYWTLATVNDCCLSSGWILFYLFFLSKEKQNKDSQAHYDETRSHIHIELVVTFNTRSCIDIRVGRRSHVDIELVVTLNIKSHVDIYRVGSYLKHTISCRHRVGSYLKHKISCRHRVGSYLKHKISCRHRVGSYRNTKFHVDI